MGTCHCLRGPRGVGGQRAASASFCCDLMWQAGTKQEEASLGMPLVRTSAKLSATIVAGKLLDAGCFVSLLSRLGLGVVTSQTEVDSFVETQFERNAQKLFFFFFFFKHIFFVTFHLLESFPYVQMYCHVRCVRHFLCSCAEARYL